MVGGCGKGKWYVVWGSIKGSGSELMGKWLGEVVHGKRGGGTWYMVCGKW